MKKEIIIIATLALFLITPQVFADSDHSKKNNHDNKNKVSVVNLEQEIITPTITPFVTRFLDDDDKEENKRTRKIQRALQKNEISQTDEDDDEDSEGCDPDDDYRNHGDYVSCVAKEHRGGKAVSEAARSDIGKKHFGEKPTGTVAPSPISSPVTSAVEALHFDYNPFHSFTAMWERFIKFFKHFI